MVGSGLSHKHQTRLERDKHPSLLRKVVTYGRKKFYNIGACSQLRTMSFSIHVRGGGESNLRQLRQNFFILRHWVNKLERFALV
jgi:hypothetical protein